MSETEPATPAVSPALESAAAALLADLARRGVPADEIPEAVALALAVQQGRIEALEGRIGWLEYHILARHEHETAASRAGGWPVEQAARARPQSVAPLAVLTRPPRFRHDCEHCTFLGRSEDGTADLYYCEAHGWDHVTFRAGTGPAGSLCCGVDHARSRDCPDPHLAEAYRRAVAAGLVAGDPGEGG